MKVGSLVLPLTNSLNILHENLTISIGALNIGRPKYLEKNISAYNCLKLKV